MSIIFPLFGTGTPQGTTDGYFLEGTDLKRIKSESFEIDTLFSNIDGFFVDRKENLYTSGGGSVKKYIKNFQTGSFIFAWQVSGGFSGGAILATSREDRGFNYGSYPFTSGFASVAVDSRLNFYFRDTTDSNNLKKYSAGGQLITSTSSDIGEFAVNKDNIISFSGNTVTKRNLSGNSVSSFTVTGIPRDLNSNQVFVEEPLTITGNTLERSTIRGYDLNTESLVWENNLITFRQINNGRGSVDRVFLDHNFIPLKNGNLLINIYSFRITYQRFGDDDSPDPRPPAGGNQFHGYFLISPSGQLLNNGGSSVPGFVELGNSNYAGTDIAQFLTTQGSNSDRSRLNF